MTPKHNQEWKGQWKLLVDEVIEDMESYIESESKLSYQDELFNRLYVGGLAFIQNELTQARQEERERIVKKIERMKMPGDFAGMGVMKLLGMNAEDVTHDVVVYNEALDDVLQLLKGEK